MRTPEVERVAKPQCFPKDNARKTTWKFLPVETDCFQFFYLVLVSVSYCPHCHYISSYVCASWPVWYWCIVLPVKNTDLLFIVARSEFPPFTMPQGICICQSNKAMAIPSSLNAVFVRFSAGKCMYFPPCILEGWPSGWGTMFCSPLHLCVTRGQHLSEEFLLFALFICIFLLCLCSVWQDNSEPIVKAVSGHNFWDTIFTVFSSV